jgi:hypothetical protein
MRTLKLMRRRDFLPALVAALELLGKIFVERLRSQPEAQLDEESGAMILMQKRTEVCG